MPDYFGDEDGYGTLRNVFGGDHARLQSQLSLNDAHGKRFANRLLSDAKAEFGPNGSRAQIHFPKDVKSIDCFAVDMRGSHNPLKWGYEFEVQKCRAVDGVDQFVTAFTGEQLATIASAYSPGDSLYHDMFSSVDRAAASARTSLMQNMIRKARKHDHKPE